MSGRACAVLYSVMDMPLVTCAIVVAVDENLLKKTLSCTFNSPI